MGFLLYMLWSVAYKHMCINSYLDLLRYSYAKQSLQKCQRPGMHYTSLESPCSEDSESRRFWIIWGWELGNLLQIQRKRVNRKKTTHVTKFKTLV